jgi:predicted dehydrogenase
MKHAQDLRVGLIGAGSIGRHYVKTFKAVTGGTLAAAADVSEAALSETAKIDGGIACFKDYRAMLKQAKLDAVVVATPNKLHVQPVLAALRAGLPTLVEKPMAMNARDAAAMCAAARRARRLLMIGFQQRFHPIAQFIRRAVDAGELGRIQYVRCQALRRRGIPSWGLFGRKDIQGGGPMIDIGVHILETAHYITGKPAPASADASCYTYIGRQKPAALAVWGPWDHTTYTVEDLAVGLIRFRNGMTLSIESSFAAHIEKDVWNVVIMGEKGGAQFDPPRLFKDNLGHMLDITPSYLGEADPFRAKIQHFVDCARTGCACQAPGEDGLVVQKMLDAVYRSADTGKVALIR